MEKTMNRVELNGFVGINPEVKTLSNGKTMTRFSLATNDDYKDKNGEWVKDTTWHNVVVWNSKALPEGAEVKKGSRVHLTGKLKNRQYTDKQGVVRYVTEVIGSKLELVPAE